MLNVLFEGVMVATRVRRGPSQGERTKLLETHMFGTSGPYRFADRDERNLRSGGEAALVTVVQTADQGRWDHLSSLWRIDRAAFGAILLQRKMSPRLMIVIKV